MKKILILLLFLGLTGCATLGFAEDKPVAPEVAEPPALTEIQQARADILKWKIMYFKEACRAIELEYTGLCYKDNRYQSAVLKKQELDRELKGLLLGGGK